jgi:hypothetical protein
LNAESGINSCWPAPEDWLLIEWPADRERQTIEAAAVLYKLPREETSVARIRRKMELKQSCKPEG